jgi:hypothetical protein
VPFAIFQTRVSRVAGLAPRLFIGSIPKALYQGSSVRLRSICCFPNPLPKANEGHKRRTSLDVDGTWPSDSCQRRFLMNETPDRRLIFANPERRIMRTSPDGTRIAFLAPVEGVLNLWIAPLEDLGNGRPVTSVSDRNLRLWIQWMYDDRHVLFFRDHGGDENWVLWCVDLESGNLRALTPTSGMTSYLHQVSIHFPASCSSLITNGRNATSISTASTFRLVRAL